ncbi:AMP-binding protein [Pseudonocardia sp. KRD-184]|uniref:AMP-binding protein n=1 Tax=Pseudonocardia oceani TaxID=2792013 RepID=A0ABS6U7Z2_9PSEU|nr:AMP-binding protein [Pseudonocardia oceani]MBW0091850.1 AMP-binding protein [Pseudonocardia oceani]MBW0098970.1 AMP-binding protein [Pseudonocardia oceani]MBW0111459.1 AMP-binding protein [Pseudonocardia oceani]MBW0125206.1 AMP-binding protein [Pseudonocardia oceani]MBW0128039.1 AMP-binding protein [Pseudonocardia oceani]
MTTLDYPEVPVGALLAGAARRYGDRTALHFAGRELSYSALHARAGAFANALHGAGIGRGDVVAIHLPNCPQYAVAYYGILMAGAAFSPTNPLLPPPDLAAQLADCGAVAAVTWAPAAPALAAVRDRTAIRLVLVTDREQAVDPAHRLALDGSLGDARDFEEFHAEAPTAAPAVEIDVHRDLAHLAYTGGTTGRSKGVQLPHRNVVVNVLQYACGGSGSVPALDDEGGLVLDQVGSPEEFPTRLGTGVAIGLAPWFHAMGTIGGLNVPTATGATTVLHERFDPGAYLADAERFGITGMSGAPPVYGALLRHPDFATRDLSTIRGLSSGAAPLPVEMIQGLQRRLGEDVVITEGYGLTEVTMGATIGPAARSAVRKPGTVGPPVADTEVRIVDPAGTDMTALPTGEPGEVVIRGPQVMVGYKDRPEDNEAVLVDGWLRTGDIGVLDGDGYLSIVDRKKDLLLYKGYNVYPRDLEEILHAQPGVAGAAVVGRPDPEVGELPVAFVVAPGADPEALMEAVNAQVTPYKRLRELHLVDAIPVSAAGKVLKRELRERLQKDTNG